MIELVVLMSAIPIAVGAVWGVRRGAIHVVAAFVPVAVAWFAGTATAATGIRAAWFWPAGLLTPLLLGLLVSFACWRLFARKLGAALLRSPGAATWPDRSTGALLGAAGGAFCAVMIWIIAQLVSTLASDAPFAGGRGNRGSDPAGSPSLAATSALIDIANEGFVRHLPVVKQLGEELEAVAYIVKTPIESRQAYARSKQWDSLTELSTFRALVENEEVLQEIDAASDGNLAALYRLQRHPQVIDFFNEKNLRELLSDDLRASQIAKELARFAPKTQ